MESSVGPAMKARDRQTRAVKTNDEAVGARRRPGLRYAEVLNLSALDRLEEATPAAQRGRHPKVRMDFPHHPLAIGFLPKDEFDHLPARSEDTEPIAAIACAH